MSHFAPSEAPMHPAPSRAALPDPEAAIHPPGLFAPWREMLTPIDWLRLARDWRKLPKGESATPRNAVLVPGFGASPLSMKLLAQALRRRGHSPFDWGLGRNSGQVAELLPRLVERCAGLVEGNGEPLVAIGWSLGGYLAREAARDRPDLIRQVITLGSPVIGGPSYTRVAPWYQARGYDLSEIRRLVVERYEVPLEVPTLGIYSKRDGIVSWRACIDDWSPNVRHVEVEATHLSMGSSPEVLRLVLEELDR